MAIDEESSFDIPTVDIAPYLADPDSDAAAKVVADVRRACMTTGFFQLVGHSVKRDLQEELFRASARLFALPMDVKKKLRPVGDPDFMNRGYELLGGQVLEEGTHPDFKEGYMVGQHIPFADKRRARHPQLMGENIFPAELPDADLRDPVMAYYAAVRSLADVVLAILAKGLPYGDDVFAAFASNDPMCNLRLLHYPPQTSQDEKQLGAGAHTDFGAMTLLYQDTSGGLEVLNQATNTWVPVTPNPDAYVVNIGDMLSMWTKNVYKSNVHRVINRSATDRYSAPFFFDGNLDTKLSPLDGSPPADGVVRTAGQHMLERLGTTFGRAETAEKAPEVLAAAS